ncbi:MAG: alpha/beta fold hydrolase [Deltaproteobacteria bacterium]|nr:alpha/beta fold hydrolase [Deltaproteobacteria bacterium]
MPESNDPLRAFTDLWMEAGAAVMRSAQSFWDTVPGGFRPPQSVLDEYRADLSGLPPEAFTVDFMPLTEAWTAQMQGRATEHQQAMVRDWTDAASVKARLGPEYYADPEQTPVRPSPRDLVHTEGPIELHRYARPEGVAPRGAPVLIVYSVINRSYILDLTEGDSFVAHLLAQGLDVFMVEWGPTEAGESRSLDWTITQGLHACVQAIEGITDAPKVALFGHCIGATFGAMYAALHPDRVSRFLSLTAPYQPAEDGVVAFVSEPERFPVDQVTGSFGQMPAKLIRHTFIALKPYYELTKWRTFIRSLGNERAMARFRLIDRWANDNVDVPAGVFAAFVREVLQSRNLVEGAMVLDGRPVDLGAIDCPILTVHCADDWIVRPESALALHEARGERVTDRVVTLPGGHLALLLDGSQRERWPELSDFLLGEAATS